MIAIRLLDPPEVERLVRRPDDVYDWLDPHVGLCTIMDVLEVAEDARKGRGHLDRGAFLEGWGTLRAGAIAQGGVQVAVLDQDRLTDALFERDETIVIGLWCDAVGRHLPPDRTVRRLVLRPSELTWWGDDLYQEMEGRYAETTDGIA
jgi:hypothetical protein